MSVESLLFRPIDESRPPLSRLAYRALQDSVNYRAKRRGESFARDLMADVDGMISESMLSASMPAWLSGEWAGESLRECLGVDPDSLDAGDLEDMCSEYEYAADQAVLDTLVDAGRYLWDA